MSPPIVRIASPKYSEEPEKDILLIIINTLHLKDFSTFEKDSGTDIFSGIILQGN